MTVITFLAADEVSTVSTDLSTLGQAIEGPGVSIDKPQYEQMQGYKEKSPCGASTGKWARLGEIIRLL